MSKFKVAITDYNIDSDERYIAINSDYTNLMIIDDQDIAGSASEYQHGLGYLPTTFEFFKYGSQVFPLESPVYNTSDSWVAVESPICEYDTDKIYITNTDSLALKILISGNAADNSTGSGKNNATGKIKIAKSGLNVPDITDVRQFQFCSGIDMIKKDLALSGSTQLVSDGSFTKQEITHNLGYIPMAIAKLTTNDYDSNFNNMMLPINLDLFSLTPLSWYATSTKLVIFIEGVAGTFNVSYNIYRNKLA